MFWLLAIVAIFWYIIWPLTFGRRVDAHPRVLIVSTCGGAGKSTLARAMAKAQGLRYIGLDDCKYGPKWARRSAAQFETILEQAIAESNGRYVIEGIATDPKMNEYESILQRIVAREDLLVIVLDVPKVVALWRVFRRSCLRRLGWEAQGTAPETWTDMGNVMTKVWTNAGTVPNLGDNSVVVQFPWYIYA